jgi:hypothetical protein
MISCICGFKEVLLAVLDWCGRYEALLIAIVGFLSSVVIVKITSGLDIKKALCMRRLDAYEKAISHLSLKLNVYYNIQAAFESFKEPALSVDLMKNKIAICLAVFQKLGEIEKKDDKVIVDSYYENAQGEKVDCDFNMLKKPTKRYLFFNEWKLDIEHLVIENCKIVVPEGLVVYVDGVELTNDNSAFRSIRSRKKHSHS